LFALDIYFSMRSRSEVDTLKAALLYKLNLVVQCQSTRKKGDNVEFLFFVKIISSFGIHAFIEKKKMLLACTK
jgi:hypothetical protein